LEEHQQVFQPTLNAIMPWRKNSSDKHSRFPELKKDYDLWKEAENLLQGDNILFSPSLMGFLKNTFQ
jgi:hypothetical protein